MSDMHKVFKVLDEEETDEDGDLDLTTSQTATIIEQDYFETRRPDLGGGIYMQQPCSNHLRKHSLLSPVAYIDNPVRAGQQPSAFSQLQTGSASGCRLVGDTDDEMAESQPTQQATQPHENPLRLGRNLSDVSDDDACDVICLFHPNSPAAFAAVQATMLHGPEHILQNNDLEGITEEDMLFAPRLQKSREFALRMSSTVKKPTDGFRFGRNPALCDILLSNDRHDKLISNVHFKVFVNEQGSLMLQDLSTNGTIVDDEHLSAKDRRGLPSVKPAMRALKNGSIICVVGGADRQEIKLMVRRPNRGDNEDEYERKLKIYLAQRGKVATFASMRENTIGNEWNGGTDYNFTGLAGKGAFATVYRVQTKNEGTVFAAKEIDKRRFVKNGHLDVKFDSELQIMKRLKHPNIVEYINCHLYQHFIYIIMEYVPYGELSKQFGDDKTIPEHEVQQIAKQVSRALDYLHRRNITHRDIKPDNILIASKDPFIVKLSDFGLSKCITTQETFLKTFCGTLLYCAPEVYPDYDSYALGHAKRRRAGEPAPKTSPYNQSVDIWSLGAVLFHVLCGKPPIMGRGDDRGAQMLNNIMTKDVEFQPLREKGVSEHGIDFIRKLLNRNPLLRPREKECWIHPWLANVPDPFEYEPDNAVPDVIIQRALEAVEELDEDDFDEEIMQGLNELTNYPPSSAAPASSSPGRPTKRIRTASESATIPAEVAYPFLPPGSGSTPMAAPSTPGARLFGEISASLMQSSGVFGAQSPVRAMHDVPGLRNAIQQVSVNDYASYEGESHSESMDVSGSPMQYPNALRLNEAHIRSAASLLGAEDQIGQLQMASPEAAPSDAGTPDTTHPITPGTRELSPSSSIRRSTDDDLLNQRSNSDLRFSRRIDVNLLHNEAAYAASMHARKASRAEKMRGKSETFHMQPHTATELMETIGAHSGRQAQSQSSVAGPALFSRTIQLPRTEVSGGSSSELTHFGKLTPVPGSFGENQVIDFDRRLTSWGRGADTTLQYPDIKDTRIPKYGIKITFWAPGMEKHVARGGKWTALPGIRTYISTSTTKHIYVNDIPLHKESENGEAALYGKVYTGDIITVYKGHDENEYMKYKVEITYGDSARDRPEKEKPFEVLKEMSYHQQAKVRESIRRDSASVSGSREMVRTVPQES